MTVDPKEVFKEELAMIENQEIKDGVIYIFEELTPDYFWKEPCSSTGKYHPRWNQGSGGIVRHVKVTAFYGKQFCRAMPLTKEEVMKSGLGTSLYEDVVVAACLLHDCLKHGPNYDGTRQSMPTDNIGMHGINMSKRIFEKMFREKGRELTFKWRAILRGIAGHMGVWTDERHPDYHPNFQKNPVLKKVCRIVFYSDYISSRKPTDEMYKIMEYGG